MSVGACCHMVHVSMPQVVVTAWARLAAIVITSDSDACIRYAAASCALRQCRAVTPGAYASRVRASGAQVKYVALRAPTCTGMKMYT